MRRFSIFLGCVALLAVAAGDLRADQVSATLSIGPADIVTLSDTKDVSGLYTGAVYAGELDWTPAAPATEFPTYCIDITSDIYLGSNYTYNIVSLSGALSTNPLGVSKTLPAGAATDIEKLWGTYYTSIIQPNDLAGNADRAAAFQIDIWKIIYPNLTVSPAWGSSGWENPLYSPWETDPNWVSHLTGTPSSLVALDSTTAQDQAMLGSSTIGHDFAVVPCPSSFAAGMALCGLMGISLLRGSFLKLGAARH